MRNEVTFTSEELQAYFNKMQLQAMQQQAQIIAQSMQQVAPK
jgi:hypothetical protein